MSINRNLNSVYPEAEEEFKKACSHCDERVWKLFNIDPYTNEIFKRNYLEFIQGMDVTQRFSGTYEKNLRHCIFYAIRTSLQQEENEILKIIKSAGISLNNPSALISFLSDFLIKNPNSYPGKKLLAQAEVYKEIETIPSFAGKLAFSEIWKLVIDGKKWELGDYIFENEPGYIVSTLQGLLFALRTRDKEKTPEWYIQLHDICTASVYNQLGRIQQIFVDTDTVKKKFDDPDMYLTYPLYTQLFISGTRTGAIGYEIRQLDQDIYGRIDLENDNRNKWIVYGYNIVWKIERNGLMIVLPQTKEAITKRINKLFSGYQSLLSEAQDKIDKLIANLWLVRELELHHFFDDGNGRSTMLALQSMVCSKSSLGLFPMLFYDPNVLDANGPEKLCLRAIEAMGNLNGTSASDLGILKEMVIKKFHNQQWNIIHQRTGLNDIYELPVISNYFAKLHEIGLEQISLNEKHQKALDAYEIIIGKTQLTPEIAENFILKLKSMTKEPDDYSDLIYRSSLLYLRATEANQFLDIEIAPPFLKIERKIKDSVRSTMARDQTSDVGKRYAKIQEYVSQLKIISNGQLTLDGKQQAAKDLYDQLFSHIKFTETSAELLKTILSEDPMLSFLKAVKETPSSSAMTLFDNAPISYRDDAPTLQEIFLKIEQNTEMSNKPKM